MKWPYSGFRKDFTKRALRNILWNCFILGTSEDIPKNLIMVFNSMKQKAEKRTIILDD